ncbi:MAG: hypothetical protein K2J63_00805 [Muribaculaceae bacterium]|nr:hypothetical protein [Muribaculaceae bacterium]MDE6793828.1 hypothetical protein [Muribaculaceae bacterium]
MKKPIFPYCNTIYTISWILTVPILIDISTACTLFSFWLVWLLFILVLIISIIRLWHGFAQKCYKFCLGLIGQLLLGAAILGFFQLSFNNVIQTPFSHPLAPDIVEIANPVLVVDSTKPKPTKDIHTVKETSKMKDSDTEKKATEKNTNIQVEKSKK